MKKIIFTVIIISFFYTEIKGQSSGWYFINPQPTNMTLNCVKFLNQNNAIAIGYWGTIIRTTDAGLNWSNPLSTSLITGLEKLHYFDMEFFDQNTGFVIGDNSGGISKLFKTTNMGLTWSFVSQFISLARTMYFIDQNTGWIGNGITMLKTTNGGSNWISITPTFPSSIVKVEFLDSMIGFTATSGKIYKSTDGGINWLLIYTSSSSIGNIFFLNSETGFALGGNTNSFILKTTNSGATWNNKLSTSNSTGILGSIKFINSMTGYAVGGNFSGNPAIYKSVDEGETWIQIPIATSYYLNSIDFLGNTGLIVGYGGRVARSSDQGLSWSVSSSFHQPGLSFSSLSFIDESTGWISRGGYTGGCQIYKSINGGLNWDSIYTASPAPDYIQFFNINTGYYKSGNTLYKSTNSGYNWTQLPSLNIILNSLYFSDANNIWACGFTSPPLIPRVIRSINGGNTWDPIPVPLDYSSVDALYFINNNTGWISKTYVQYPMGNYSKIYKTTDSGQNWNYLRSDSGMIYNKISFINNLTGWASGNNNFIKTTNGGNNWVILPVNSIGANFQFIDANTGWAATQLGPLYKTINGGINWYSTADMGLAGLSAFQFINGQTGWGVGEEGLILKTIDGGGIVGSNNISTTLPHQFTLLQNYPNPFNPTTKIKFAIHGSLAAQTFLVIYDILGKEVTTLVNESLKPGNYQVEWDGSQFASGVYFYKLVIGDNTNNGGTGNFTETKKMVLIK